MAYDERLAGRIRDVLANRGDVVEKKMFGNLAFMVKGNMCCGVVGDELMARVGPDGYQAALKRPHARPMDFTGKPLKGFVYVAPEGSAAPDALESWIGLALEFVETLPAK